MNTNLHAGAQTCFAFIFSKKFVKKPCLTHVTGNNERLFIIKIAQLTLRLSYSLSNIIQMFAILFILKTLTVIKIILTTEFYIYLIQRIFFDLTLSCSSMRLRSAISLLSSVSTSFSASFAAMDDFNFCCNIVQF